MAGIADNMTHKLPITVFAVLAASIAGAQGLYVQPASYEMSVSAGASYDLPLALRNNQPDISNNVEISALYLTQDLGGFEAVDLDKVTPDILKQFPSCLSWIRLPDTSKLTMPALSVQAPLIHIAVPAGARGFYGACIVVTSQRTGQGTGVNMVLRFVIPVLLSVETGVARKAGEVEDTAASFVPPGPSRTAGTQIALMVKNSGATLTRYSGTASLFQTVNGRKRRIIAATLDERRVIPNATVALTYISPKLIPSGTYRVEAQMTMEGQKLRPFAKDIVVSGDPSVKTAVADVELGLAPDPIELDAIPGAFRGLAFKVQNSGSDPIVVDASVATPKAMQGAIGPFGSADDISLAPWCRQPLSGAMIGAGQERTLRIVATIPDGKLTHPFYYGQLNVVAKTPEGNIIGSGSLLMIAKNREQASMFGLAPNGDVVVSSIDSKLYGFTSSFENTGDTDISPQVQARITDTAGLATIMALQTAEVPKRLLPLQSFRPSGTIDAGLLKDGAYLIEIIVKAGNIGQTKTAGIRVKTVNKIKTLSLIDVAKPKTKTSAKVGGAL